MSHGLEFQGEEEGKERKAGENNISHSDCQHLDCQLDLTCHSRSIPPSPAKCYSSPSMMDWDTWTLSPSKYILNLLLLVFLSQQWIKEAIHHLSGLNLFKKHVQNSTSYLFQDKMVNRLHLFNLQGSKLIIIQSEWQSVGPYLAS